MTIDAMLKTMYPGKYQSAMDEQAAAGYQEIGNAYEEMVQEQLRRKFSRYHKPAPIQYRGFVMSPDGVDESSRVLHEMKATWVSTRRFLEIGADGVPTFKSFKYQRYEYQVLGYLKALGWTDAQLHVWFINGPYPKGPPKPEWPWTIELKYSQREIDTGFRTVWQFARDMKLL